MPSRSASDVPARYFAIKNGVKVSESVANHTLAWRIGGGPTAVETAIVTTGVGNRVAETLSPGEYDVLLTSAETTCSTGKIVGTSSSGAEIIGEVVSFEQVQTAIAGLSAAGGTGPNHLTDGAYILDVAYGAYPTWSQVARTGATPALPLVVLWSNGTNWYLSEVAGTAGTEYWLGPATANYNPEGSYAPQGTATGTIAVTARLSQVDVSKIAGKATTGPATGSIKFTNDVSTEIPADILSDPTHLIPTTAAGVTVDPAVLTTYGAAKTSDVPSVDDIRGAFETGAYTYFVTAGA
jgi:hypothetical protein